MLEIVIFSYGCVIFYHNVICHGIRIVVFGAYKIKNSENYRKKCKTPLTNDFR